MSRQMSRSPTRAWRPGGGGGGGRLAPRPGAGGRRCRVCWLPLDPYEACRGCAEHRPAFSAVRAPFRYAGDVRTLVHAFKYEGRTTLAGPLTRALVGCYREHGLAADVVVPV